VTDTKLIVYEGMCLGTWIVINVGMEIDTITLSRECSLPFVCTHVTLC